MAVSMPSIALPQVVATVSSAVTAAAHRGDDALGHAEGRDDEVEAQLGLQPLDQGDGYVRGSRVGEAQRRWCRWWGTAGDSSRPRKIAGAPGTIVMRSDSIRPSAASASKVAIG